MMDAMATGTFSTRPLECSAMRSWTPVASPGSHGYAVRFPLFSSDPTVMHHCYDVTAVRRVANTNEQSDDFVVLAKARKWRGDATGFARARRAVPMAKVLWAPEPSLLHEMPYEDFRVDVLERFGEVGAEFSMHIMRLPWSLFQPQKVHFSVPS